MSKTEVESLCDGCGMCCTNKLGTRAPARSCRPTPAASCSTPGRRAAGTTRTKKIVPDCIKLTPKVVARMDWLPKTCAYRLVHFGQDLYWWHPLISGDPETVHQAGISAAAG